MKIAVVNLEQAIMQSSQGKALQRSLQAFQRKNRSEIQGLTGDLHELSNRINNGKNTFTEEHLVSLGQELAEGQQELQRFQEEKQREGERLRQQEVESIKQKLPPILASLRSENGYDVILNSKMVLAAVEGVDITKLVTERLSQEN